MAAACVYNVPPRLSYVNIREIRCLVNSMCHPNNMQQHTSGLANY